MGKSTFLKKCFLADDIVTVQKPKGSKEIHFSLHDTEGGGFLLSHVNLKIWSVTFCTSLGSTEALVERKRPLAFSSSHVILICFSIDNKSSYESVRTRWFGHPHVPKVPIILVGMKKDRRGEADCISEEQGKELMNQIGAKRYIEISSLGENAQAEADAVADAAIEVALEDMKNH